MNDFIDDNSSQADAVADPAANDPAATELVASRELPVLPLRNSVLYPQVTMPFGVGRTESILAVEAALLSEDKHLLVFAQRNSTIEQPSAEDLYEVGTEAVIKHMVRGKDGFNLVLQGVERVRRVEEVQATPFLSLRVESFPLPDDKSPATEALLLEVMKVASRFHELSDIAGDVDFGQFLSQLDDPLQTVFMLGAMLSPDLEKAQRLLEMTSREAAFRILLEELSHEVQVLELRREIASQTQSEITDEQRKFILRKQLRTIQKELGELSPEEAEVIDLRMRLDGLEVSDDVLAECNRALDRLESLPASSSEYQVLRSYLELVFDLPWSEETTDNLNLASARSILDADHYGLRDVKERIIEQLAVLRLNPKASAPILCFVGPPGVGKTSLGQSIARSLGRKFERFSLGGMHDEAELRGHRRTYIGAMPGRIIQAVRRACVRNPVIMLDEVDKLGHDYRGDPAAALLEILDPAQNSTFRDNYLDLPFDLSKVFFILTANTLDTIPRPLLDRVEVIRLSGYSDEEKLEIAKRYLLPRRLEQTGLKPDELIIPDETLQKVIRRYTREAGVRDVERQLGALSRKVAVDFAEGRTKAVIVESEELSKFLGSERFFPEEARKEMPPGVAAGLAWTESGGEVLYIEALLVPGEGSDILLTGQLGDVMRESARTARSYVLSHCEELGIDPPHGNVHLHVPAGAVPKDGPSAGITMATALTSLFSGCPVRRDTAMTGEITLTGLVLPIGGIREKALAARRSGMTRIILPAANEKDLANLPESVREDIEFIPVSTISEVLADAIPGLAERVPTGV